MLDLLDQLPCLVKPSPDLDHLAENGMSVTCPEIVKAICYGLNFLLEAVMLLGVQREFSSRDVGEFHQISLASFAHFGVR